MLVRNYYVVHLNYHRQVNGILLGHYIIYYSITWYFYLQLKAQNNHNSCHSYVTFGGKTGKGPNVIHFPPFVSLLVSILCHYAQYQSNGLIAFLPLGF